MRHLSLFTCLIILTCGLGAGVVRAQDAAPSSFDIVTANLDEGGNFYLYMSTGDFMKSMAKMIAGYRPALVAFAADENGTEGGEHMGAAVDMAIRIVDEGGLAHIGGVGMSTTRVGEREYRSKSFIHITEPADGKLVNVYGRPAHELTALKLLPAHTVAAVNTDFDAATMWTWMDTMIRSSKGPNWATDWASEIGRAKEDGVDIAAIAKGLGGEFTFLVTMDPETPVKLTLDGEKSLEVGTPAMALVVAVKDKALMNAIAAVIEENGDEVERSTADGVDMIVMPADDQVGFKVQPTIAQADGYVIIASSDDLARQIVSTLRGKSPNITTVQEFLKWDRGMPDAANGFLLITPTLTKTVGALQKEVVASAEEDLGPDMEQAMSLLKDMVGTDAYYLYQVTLRTETGLASITNSSKPAAAVAMRQFMILPLLAATSEIFPDFALDPVTAARRRTEDRIRQVGLALLVYAYDNDASFPTPDGAAGLDVLDKQDILDIGEYYLSGRDDRPMPRGKITEATTSWAYIGAGMRDDHDNATMIPLVIEKPGKDPWVHVLFIDGHSEIFAYDGTTIEGVIDLLHTRYEDFRYDDKTLKLLKDKAKARDAAEPKR